MKFKKDTISTMGAFFSAGGFSIKQYQKELSIARDRILEGSRVVKTAQGRIEYATAGKGLPVLNIHGAGGGHDMGRFFARRVGDDFFWICPSRFGYLRSPIPQDASFEYQADNYAALLDYLHIKKATISDKQYELDRINLPTLILHTLDDRLVDYDFAKYAHAHIPNSELVAFPSSGHLLLGQDKQYRKVVTGFLKQHL
jgi:pimeloyl-ACP methyl ester carboxylesterase